MATEPKPSHIEDFAADSVIVRERDVDKDAYIILSGKVEVFKGAGAKKLVLAQLGPGQIFGEMAMVLERPRTASVRAVEPTKVWRITADAFAKSLSADKETASILKLIFERIRTINADAVHNAGMIFKTPAGAAPSGTMKRLPVLSGATPRARACLEAVGGSIKIASLPFLIGRRTHGLFADILSHNDLYLEDRAPHQVSRHHCSINGAHDGTAYFVQDRGSTLGTIVNGREIGLDTGENQAPLDLADNEVVLGAAASELRFKVSFRDTAS